jgi:hypothetical protein
MAAPRASGVMFDAGARPKKATREEGKSGYIFRLFAYWKTTIVVSRKPTWLKAEKSPRNVGFPVNSDVSERSLRVFIANAVARF